MEKHEKEFITQHKPKLLSLIVPSTHMLSLLEQQMLLETADVESITCCRTQTDKVSTLLNVLQTRTGAYKKLVEALQTAKQSGAVDVLMSIQNADDLITDHLIEPKIFQKPDPNVLDFLNQDDSSTNYRVLLSHDVGLSVRRIYETIDFQVRKDEDNREADTVLLFLGTYGKQLLVRPHQDNLIDEDDHFPETIQWSDVTDCYRGTLLNRTIEVQGHRMVLEDFLQEAKKVTTSLSSSLLSSIADKLLVGLINDTNPKLLAGNILNIPHSNISRYFLSRQRVSRDVLNIVKSSAYTDILIFQGLKYYELGPFLEKYCIYDSSRASKVLAGKTTNCRAILLETKSDFKRLCRIVGDKPVHLLDCVNSNDKNVVQLYWVKSHGSMKSLQKFVHKQQNQQLAEKLLSHSLEIKSSAVILSGSQGMGKSFLLTQFAKETLSISFSNKSLRGYTQFIECPEFVRLFNLSKNKQSTNINFEEHVKPILVDIACSSKFEKEIVNALLSIDSSQQNFVVHFFLDGIDDLQQDDICIIEKIVDAMKRASVKSKFWATTRPHLLERIESWFSVLGWSLMPFREQDHVILLKSIWSKKVADEARSEFVARKCLRRLSRKISGGEEELPRTPLMGIILANSYEEDAIINCVEDEDNVFGRNITDLTITEIYNQYTMHVFQQKNHDNSIPVQHKIGFHMEKAIHCFFPDNNIAYKGAFTQDIQYPLDQMLVYGIVEKRTGIDTIRFAHISIQKYFVAKAAIELIKILGEQASGYNNVWVKCANLLMPLMFRIFSVNKKEQVGIEGDSYLDYSFKNVGICYFLNNFMSDKIDISIVENLFLRHSESRNDSPLKKLYSVLYASIASNLCNIALPALTLYINLLEKEKNRLEFLRSQEYKILILLACKYSSQLLPSLCNRYSFWVKCPILQWKIDRVTKLSCPLNYVKTMTSIETFLHVAVEEGKLENVKYLIISGDAANQNLEYEFKNIYDRCLLNSCKQSQEVIQQKIQILHLLEEKFGTSVLTQLQAERLLVQQMHLQLLLTFLKILNRFKYFKLSNIRQISYHEAKLVASETFRQSEREHLKHIIKNHNGENILHLLASNHYDEEITAEKYHTALEEIKSVIDLQAHLEARNCDDWRAVDVAASSLDLLPKTLDLFKLHNIDFSATDFRGSNIIFKAIAGHRSNDFIKRLIEKVGIWDCTKFLGETVLHVAAANNNYDAIVLFASNNPQLVISIDNEQNTPLHKCFHLKPKCKKMQVMIPVSRRCFSEGPKINKSREAANEPINQQKNIKYLIENGANIKAQNSMKKTPLHLCKQIFLGGLKKDDRRQLKKEFRKNRFEEKSMTLALRGLLLNKNLGDKWHPSLVFTFAGKLIEQGGNVKITDKQNGYSLLHLAAQEHSYFGVKCLLDNLYIDPNVVDKNKRNALQSMLCYPSGCDKYNCKKIRNYLEDKLIGYLSEDGKAGCHKRGSLNLETH